MGYYYIINNLLSMTACGTLLREKWEPILRYLVYKTKNDITRLKFLKGYFALRTDGRRDKDQLGDYYNNPH